MVKRRLRVVAKGTGEYGDPSEQPLRTIPAKQPGVHRWVATSVYYLTAGQARVQTEGGLVNLDLSNLITVAVGCIDCEHAYEEAPATCQAGDTWSGS